MRIIDSNRQKPHKWQIFRLFLPISQQMGRFHLRWWPLIDENHTAVTTPVETAVVTMDCVFVHQLMWLLLES